MAGFLGSGVVRINRKDPTTGSFLGWTKPIYASRFELQAAAELRELPSKGRDDFGQVIGSVAVQQPATFSMTLQDADKDAMTLMFLGDQAALTQATTAVVDELVRARTGFDIRVAGQNISSVVITSSPSGTSYVLNTDFRVANARLGIIEVIAGSSLATAIAAAPQDVGLPLLVDYTPGALSGTQIRGSTQPSLRAAISFDGKNQESGKDANVEIWEVVLTPDAGFDFLGDDWAEVPLTGRMIKPVDKPSPFVINLRA